MTKEASRQGKMAGEVKSLLLFAITVAFGLLLSAEAVEYAREGMRLAVSSVIPSSLPFMVISDFYICYGNPENIRLLRSVFGRLLGLDARCLSPFICGNIGGFPIGAKMTADLYSLGVIDKDDAQRLVPLSNNPSCAFVIGGVGLGIYKDVRVGFMLLFSVYTATLLCGIITRTKQKNYSLSCVNMEQKFDFVSSVKRAGIGSIGIISFISIFSVINGLIKNHVKFAPFLIVFSLFSEVTNSINILSATTILSRKTALILSAFSLGFGGVCVGMQSSVFTSPVGIKMRKYYAIKLLEGIISATVFALILAVCERL